MTEMLMQKPWMTFMAIAVIPLAITQFIYGIRVWSGLVNVYGLRRRWMWLCLIDETRVIPALLWGFSKRYQPEWQVEDIKAEMERLATSGTATVMDEGLSVNLKERTATEFFQKKILLRDIHMNIPQGHMVLLLGGSGAGKTTYLNAINGYEKANAEVLLNGSNMYTQYKRMQHEVGFVPQSEMMRGKDTVINTLLDAAKLRLPKDVSGRQRRERVNEVMDIFGLQPVKNNLVEKLSGGQKKRLSISIEFISNPSLFILDEPDSGLDGVMARELFEQLRKIADTGKIVELVYRTYVYPGRTWLTMITINTFTACLRWGKCSDDTIIKCFLRLLIIFQKKVNLRYTLCSRQHSKNSRLIKRIFYTLILGKRLSKWRSPCT